MTLLNFFHYIYKLYEFYLFKSLKCYQRCSVLNVSANFILVNKGYDLKINSNNSREETLQTYLRKNFPHLASKELCHEYYFLHRLDYSTSGLMCIPINKKACQSAAKSIRDGQCKKYYVALVRGWISEQFLDLSLPIGRDARVKDVEKMGVDQTHGISARTLIIILEKGLFENYPCTKVLIRPMTGRRHQIRVHCTHLGHTIVGDYTYSNKKDITPFRMFLHSLRLSISNDVETFDKQTEDPFTQDIVSQYQCIRQLNTIESSFCILDESCNANFNGCNIAA